MPRRSSLPLVLATVAVTGLIPSMAPWVATAREAATNDPAVDWVHHRLIRNADFEQPKAAGQPSYVAAGWRASRNGRFVSVERGDANNGHILRVRSVTPGRRVSAESDPIAVMPGESITASATAQHVSGGSGVLTVQFQRADGTPIDQGYGRAEATVSGRSWTRVSASRTVPDDATTMTVVLTAPAVGVTRWDDIVVESTAPSAYQVPDGGFEDTRDDQLHTHWEYQGQVRKQGDDVWANHRALEVTGTATQESRATSFLIPAVADDRVTVTVWAKAVSGAPGAFGADFLALDRATVDPATSDYRRTPVAGGQAVSPVPGAGWQQLSMSVDVPAGATHLELSARSAGPGVTLWDDVRINAASDEELTAYDSRLGDGSVLFVGDQKVESYTGLSRVVHPGIKTGDPAREALGDGIVLGYPGTVDSRTVSSVQKNADGSYRMWFSGSKRGVMDSVDGVRWDESTATATTDAPTTIVNNPRYGEPGQPRYFGLATGFAENADVRQRTQNYYVYVSDDGVTWRRPTPNIPALYGRDTAMVSWDPVEQRFVAMVKQWFMPLASPGVYKWEPRSAWLSYSDDFVTWSTPRLAMQSDARDYSTVASTHPDKNTTSDIYSLPTFRYGEQVLGLPWMQNVTDISRVMNMGRDISTEHIELAATQNYATWSRPAREPIVTPGADGEWDWGFMMTSTSGFVTDGDDVRLYYGSYAGEHACTAARITAGECDVLQVPSRIGMVTWKRDRFVSLRADGPTPGEVTTRVLTPAETGNELHVNADGVVRVEVLDADGRVVPGYGLGDAIPVTGDRLDAIVRWSGHDDLPDLADGIRLRIQVSGDLYSYSVK